MAAPSGTVWGSVVGGYGRIGVYVKLTNTGTTTTATAEVWFWSKYSVSDSNNTYKFDFYDHENDAVESYGSRTINTTVSTGDGWSTSNQIKLGTHTSGAYTRTTSAVTKYASAGLEDVDRVGSKMRARVPFTIPKLDSYTVSYNANGGSGAPSSQTKWCGQTLTLSSTKPTRTGYSFQGWATSASGNVAYAAGASYTANSSATLYAVWKANTYTVSYNANGGSGAPGNQTKTHGVTLTLSSTKPTRTNYTFKGWGTSASTTTVSYAAGASYTTNAAITLYAIWTLSYTKPRISNLSVLRCTSDGTADDSGTYAKVTFSWVCDKTVSSIKIEWKLSSATSWTSASVSASGTSGTVSQIVGDGAISADNTYDIRVTVADSGGNSSQTLSLAGTKFTMDLLSGGDGIAFGKPAELSGYMDIGFRTRLRHNLYMGNNYALYGQSKSGENLAIFHVSTSNNVVFGLGTYNAGVGSTNLYGNDINLYANGNVNVDSPLHLDVTTDASGTANNNPALTIGPTSGIHLEFDGNEIMAKGAATTTGTLYINQDGGDVHINKNGGTAYINGCPMATNKVLWSGAYWMQASHTCSLSSSVKSQANGIVLIWSYYDGSSAQNYAWTTTFVPKYFVDIPGSSSGGLSVRLNTSTGNTFAVKYIYVTDTAIIGNDYNKNGAGTTNAAIVNTPNAFVLRYVIGV